MIQNIRGCLLCLYHCMDLLHALFSSFPVTFLLLSFYHQHSQEEPPNACSFPPYPVPLFHLGKLWFLPSTAMLVVCTVWANATNAPLISGHGASFRSGNQVLRLTLFPHWSPSLASSSSGCSLPSMFLFKARSPIWNFAACWSLSPHKLSDISHLPVYQVGSKTFQLSKGVNRCCLSSLLWQLFLWGYKGTANRCPCLSRSIVNRCIFVWILFFMKKDPHPVSQEPVTTFLAWWSRWWEISSEEFMEWSSYNLTDKLQPWHFVVIY